MNTPLLAWISFIAIVVALLALDLTVLRRETEAVSLRSAILTTLTWILLAVGFGWGITVWQGPSVGLQFFTGYIIEYALSVDNIFIFILVFASFHIMPGQQRRLLFWGVLGALVMRGIMIIAGTALLNHFFWLIYIFGAYILYAGIAMLRPRKHTGVDEMAIVRFARRFLPLSSGDPAGRMVVRENGRWKFTLLFLVLVVIEVTDLIFALDSIPAIFGVTQDPFIVFTSNICAILGLRSLYFLLAGAVQKLVYLHIGLAFVLIFIGGKMVLEGFFEVPTGTSLLVVGSILGLAIIASLLKSASLQKSNAPS